MTSSSSLPDLSGTVAVVTGTGSGGIGEGIVRQFVAAGAAVVLHYRSSAAGAEALAKEINENGGKAVTAQADINDAEQCRALMQVAVDSFGRLDALVNNSGLQPIVKLEKMTSEEWNEVVSTNVNGTFNATQAAVEIMKTQGGGSVTSISSIEGSHPAVNHAHYCASKAAIIMHARSAALEYGPLGIRVNTVSPGLIFREGLNEAWPEGVERWLANAPLGRMGTREDIGNACVFLASPMASFITGQDLAVDGGMLSSPLW